MVIDESFMKKFLLLSSVCIALFIQSAFAVDIYEVPGAAPAFQFNVYNEGETIVDEESGESETSTYTLSENQKAALFDAAANWKFIINNNKTYIPDKLPTFVVLTYDEFNASAGSEYVDVGEDFLITAINAYINQKTPTAPSSPQGLITVGIGLIPDYPGWNYYTGSTALYQAARPDLFSTMVHEIYHAMGLITNAQKHVPGDNRFYFSKDITSKIGIWDSGLRIYQGPLDTTFDSSKILAANRGMSIKIDDDGTETFDIVNYSPYFTGLNTLQVLTGDDSTDKKHLQEIIYNKGGLRNYSSYYVDNDDWEDKVPLVLGLPVNVVEEEKPELSHIELRNSFMSHQMYQNWAILMEAELAVLKDIGYPDVELRDFFGKSYYLNGITDNTFEGYGKWDPVELKYIPGEYSDVENGIGMHIYGNNNTITQLKDTLSEGQYTIGTRIDGVNNTYTLENSLIHVKGDDSIGIAVAWGKGHDIEIDSSSSVVADGEDGIGVSFDFGKNVCGGMADDRGSYSSYSMKQKQNITPDKDTQGALINNFDVSGTVEGTKAAIYISENAHVDRININDGAKIYGDIISKWNSVQSGAHMLVMRQGADTKWYPVDKDNPEEIYYTNLNFSGNTTVNGNITGENDIQNTLNMNTIAVSVVNFSGKEINVNSLDNKGDINISQNAVIATVNNTITGDGNLNVLGGASLGLSSNITNIENAVGLDSATLNTANGSISSTTFSNLTLSGDNLMKVDVDIASQTADALNFNNPADLVVNLGASLKIENVNMMNANKAYTNEEYSIPFISAANNNQNLLGTVTLANQPTVMTPIFKYNLGYTEDATQGGFLFSRGATKKYDSYNPAVVASSVAAQFGGYLNQLNSYDQAFQNLDMKMLMTREEREALRMANTYASTVTPTVYSPIYLPEKDKGAWFRPYATFEKAGLRNGPKVENISYGSYFGGDSPMFSTKNGWDYQYSAYVGYNGSHQNYDGTSVYQNGGTLGATGIWYKGDFFTALTANVGANAAEASTMYGHENFAMLMTGVASKTGYNWELARGKFIIQPSFLMSYSFVNTFDYTNAAGVRIKSNPLNAINITPGLKFIGNLKNGWQPYAGVQMVWNIMDKTHFKANDVALPDMSVKPYIQYGVGVQKRWGDRFTGFFQAMMRNGGRNGVALSLGFRWALGK